jgi:hypothetical protein
VPTGITEAPVPDDINVFAVRFPATVNGALSFSDVIEPGARTSVVIALSEITRDVIF